MSWRSIIASPIYNGEEHKGLLLLGVPVFEKEFSYNEYNLIYNIIPLVSTVL